MAVLAGSRLGRSDPTIPFRFGSWSRNSAVRAEAKSQCVPPVQTGFFGRIAKFLN